MSTKITVEIDEAALNAIAGLITVISAGEAARAVGLDPVPNLPAGMAHLWASYDRARARAIADLEFAAQGGRVQ